MATLAVLPASALAAAPTATTDPLVSFTGSGAVLSGQATTGREDTDYYFQIGASSDAFCTSGGAEGTPLSTPAQHWPDALMTPFATSITMGGLLGGTTYCFRFVVVNADGAGYGALATFAFPVVVPMTSVRVITTGASTATADAWVFPEGQSTTAEIDYDLVGSSFCTSGGQQPATYATTPISLPTSPQMVSLPLAGLIAGDEYCVEIVAHNSSGTATSFGPTFTAGVPLVQPRITTPIGATAASVTGTVDPVGQATTYDVAYDTVSSTWCRSAGTSGAPSLATPPVPLPFTDAAYHPVTVTVRGLSPRISYCLALIAHNPSGASPIGTPASLPAMLTLTVYAFDVFAGARPGGGLVTSTPDGISCSQRCSAAFTRGARVTLHAAPRPGFGFFEWDPCVECGYGPTNICPHSSSCAVTLSHDLDVTAGFIKACTLRPASHLVHNGRLSLKATCAQQMPVSLTGTVTEIPGGHLPKRTYSLRRRHTTITGARQLELTLPRNAVTALRHGAREAATVTITYSGSVIGQATAHISHLTTAPQSSA